MSWFELKKKLLHSKKAMRSFFSFIKFNLTSSGDQRPSPLRRNHLNQRRRRTHSKTKLSHQLQSIAPVYVDELFHHHPVEVNMKKQQTEEAHKTTYQACKSSSSPSNTVENGEAIWEVEELGEVDQRAEMFIRKFKEEMRLQRHKSFVEYQEMLARGLS